MATQNTNDAITHTRAWRRPILTALLLTAFSGACQAGEDEESAQVRIRELERQMQQMAAQLKAMQEQLSRNAPATAVPDAPKAAAAKPPSGSPVEASFKNGLVFRDATGDWSLRVYARTQLDYRHFSPDEMAADAFSLRRARLGVIASFYEDFTMRLEGEYSGDGTSAKEYTKLNDGYLDYTHFKSAMLRVGQFKTMYGLERAQGAMDLNFMERGMTESLLGTVFDRGVMLHGSPLNGTYYNLAYVNGSGQNVDETSATTDGKDWSLRAVANLAQWAGWNNSVIHIGGLHVQGKQAAGALIPKLKTEGRGVEFFKALDVVGDTGRTINGFESAVAFGPVKYQGEYIRTNFDGVGFDRNLTAWYTSLQWLVTGEQYAAMYKNGVFGSITPKSNFKYGNGGWGALELGARYTHFDASDFRSVLSSPTANTDGADAWTLGAKWVLNPNAQILLNYVHTNFDTPITLNGRTDDKENAMNMRVQFDF